MNRAGRALDMGRAGASRIPAVDPAAGDLSWGDSVTRRMTALAGLTPSQISVEWDRFTTGIVTSSNFGERWVVAVGSGGYIAHQRSDGGRWGGGTAVIQASGAWADNHLQWLGPGNLAGNAATDRWGVAYRLLLNVVPAPSGGLNQFYLGLLGDAEIAAFGWLESVDATFCSFILSGTPVNLITSVTVASLHTAWRELMLVGQPVGGVATVSAYVDGALIATRVSTGLNDRTMRPYFYCNQGTLAVDDMLMVFGAAA